jgi:hypothetical protein
MITEATNGWAKNALQDFETLYIGGAEPASFAGPLSVLTGPNQDYAIAKEVTDQDGSHRLGNGSNGNKHEVER